VQMFLQSVAATILGRMKTHRSFPRLITICTKGQKKKGMFE
jgi:hypothetical protein